MFLSNYCHYNKTFVIDAGAISTDFGFSTAHQQFPAKLEFLDVLELAGRRIMDHFFYISFNNLIIFFVIFHYFLKY